VAQLLAGPGQPLFNRSVQMAIPPGSVFKVATAVALLEETAVRPQDTVLCRGYLRSPDSLRCALFRQQGRGHGEVTLSDALCASCNVYFFDRAGRLGWAPIANWACKFGFGRPTGIDLPYEAAGGLPSPRPVPGGNIDHAAELPSIGQGEVTATPIQVARMMAAVANGGKLVTPHLVRGYGLPLADGITGRGEGPAVDEEVDATTTQPIAALSPGVLAEIRAGLVRAVTDPSGSAYGGTDSPPLSWAGKTGTAETGVDGQEHAWFAGYAPANDPRIVVVVALERAGNASESAVPIARRLLGRLGPVLTDSQPGGLQNNDD
ncbi:MAG: penicillin-binding transpeptidase domain-containing protein, partial [Thermoguttaceae bacterium]